MSPPVYCAIGDVHGELARLQDLHKQVRQYAKLRFPERPVQLVHLGDLVDRGPDSCGVIEYLMDFERKTSPKPITLRGNHEQMMIDAHLSGDAQSSAWAAWRRNGGVQTMDSYSDRPAAMLERHVAWLQSLPTVHEATDARLVFVHAGVDPDRYPDCGEEVQMWTRRAQFFDPRCWTAPGLGRMRVIHGHTPTGDSLPESAGGGRRLNIDTGAVYGGRLTAALLQPGAPDEFLYA